MPHVTAPSLAGCPTMRGNTRGHTDVPHNSSFTGRLSSTVRKYRIEGLYSSGNTTADAALTLAPCCSTLLEHDNKDPSRLHSVFVVAFV